jgi:hypothetical protein
MNQAQEVSGALIFATILEPTSCNAYVTTIIIIRTYVEEEIAKQFPTEREWVYNFANASKMTENWQFCGQKYTPLETFFFQ